ncbi:MAG: T3SS effector HopA1 family protein [Candidatus Moraniibacteriota bacterium]
MTSGEIIQFRAENTLEKRYSDNELSELFHGGKLSREVLIRVAEKRGKDVNSVVMTILSSENLFDAFEEYSNEFGRAYLDDVKRKEILLSFLETVQREQRERAGETAHVGDVVPEPVPVPETIQPENGGAAGMPDISDLKAVESGETSDQTEEPLIVKKEEPSNVVPDVDSVAAKRIEQIHEGLGLRSRNDINETVFNNEMNEGAEKDLNDFSKFIFKNEQQLSGLEGIELENYIYNHFYSNDQEKAHTKDGADIEKNIEKYNAEIEKMITESLDAWGRGEKPIISVMPQGYWTFCFVGEGSKINENIGRLYINIKPEEIANFFWEAANLFSAEKLDVQMKIPSKIDQEDAEKVLNRRDKMVIYFEPKDEGGILTVLDRLHKKYRDAFLKNGPRFSAALRDFDGKIMDGIGFAEEPQFGNESFGGRMSRSLGEIFTAQKLSMSQGIVKNFNAQQMFRRICEKNGIDYTYPAFNAFSKRVSQNSPMYQRVRS